MGAPAIVANDLITGVCTNHLIIGPLGAAACLFVMIGLPPDTWLRLIIWLIIGFVVYFSYSRKHSRFRVSG